MIYILYFGASLTCIAATLSHTKFLPKYLTWIQIYECKVFWPDRIFYTLLWNSRLNKFRFFSPNKRFSGRNIPKYCWIYRYKIQNERNSTSLLSLEIICSAYFALCIYAMQSFNDWWRLSGEQNANVTVHHRVRSFVFLSSVWYILAVRAAAMHVSVNMMITSTNTEYG